MVKRILIPNGSVVQLEMSILNGGHNDPSQGWTDNCASKSESGSIYLRVEYAVIKGPYANVKFRSSIGLKVLEGNLINFAIVVLILVFTLRIKPRA